MKLSCLAYKMHTFKAFYLSLSSNDFLIIAHMYAKSLICAFAQPLSSEPHTALLGWAWHIRPVHVDFGFL